VQKTWGTFLNGKTASYLANVGQMQEMRELEHDVLFLNFLPIDRALHEDSPADGQHALRSHSRRPGNPGEVSRRVRQAL
jgi:hypothetical protein